MIKINLVAERKATKQKSVVTPTVEGIGSGQNLILVGILLVGVAVAAIWWYGLNKDHTRWVAEHAKADRELARLAEIRKKGDEYTEHKELLARKIELITDLKKMQTVPVHIMDKVSRNLPEFLWLESMTASKNRVNITGKATNYNAVSNFYENLDGSGFFADVSLGRTFEVPEGVAFSLSCNFSGAPDEGDGDLTESDEG